MGRPRLDDPRVAVSIRLTAAEMVELRRAAEAREPPQPFTVYVREAALAPLPRAPGGWHGPRAVEVETPAGAEAAVYEVRESESLVTSHVPGGEWLTDSRYPTAVQERDYHGDLSERAKVERIAQSPRPALLLSDGPTAVDGPPVVSGRGIVLGGNGRAMGLRLAYDRGTAGEYRAALRAKLPAFGLTVAEFDRLKRPILVRVVARLDGLTQTQLAAESSNLNEGLGNAMDPRAKAVALARRLSRETLNFIADQLAETDTAPARTLRAVMGAEGPRLVRRLEADGLVTAQNRSALVERSGGLTEGGKLLLEGAFLGLVAGTPERLGAAAPATLARVERFVGPLVRVEARQNGHSLIPLVQSGMDALARAQVAQMTVAQLAGQVDAFAPRMAADVVAMAMCLESCPAKRLSVGLARWAALADFDPRQVSMFGKPPSPTVTRDAFLASVA